MGFISRCKTQADPRPKNKPASERRGKGMLIYFSAKVLWENLLSSKAKV
jgi:hypothetical protein